MYTVYTTHTLKHRYTLTDTRTGDFLQSELAFRSFWILYDYRDIFRFKAASY